MSGTTIGVDPSSGKDFTAKFIVIDPEELAELRRCKRAMDWLATRVQGRWPRVSVRIQPSADDLGGAMLAAYGASEGMKGDRDLLTAVELAMKGEEGKGE